MQHPVSLGMEHGETLRAEKLLGLLRENRSTHVLALVAHRHNANLRSRVLSSMTIKMALPETLNAVVIQAVVTGKGRWLVTAFFALLLRFDDVSVGNADKHGLMLQTIAATVHVLKALEAEVVFAVRAEDLRLLCGTGRTQTPAGCREKSVILSWPQCTFVKGVSTCLTERHQALIALQR